jgi:hypothetical protein
MIRSFTFPRALVLLFAMLPAWSFAQDAGVTAIFSPGGGCGLGSATPVQIEVTNFGASAITSLDAQFLVDAVPGPVESFTVSIAPGATATLTFTATADLSGGGSFLFEATTLLAGDTDPSNDLLGSTVALGSTVGLPIEQDFTGLVDGATSFPAPLSNDPAGFLDFQVNSGGTPSISTGPSAGAGGSGKYIYMEASSGAPFQSAILQTECIDLGFGVSPRVTYAYHMFGSGIERLQLLAVRGSIIDTLSEFIGQQQTASTDPWLFDTVDLSPYNGQSVQLKWRATMGVISFTNADIALDEIRVEDPQDNDLGAVDLLAPGAFCGLSATEALTITVRNYGLLDQSGYNVGYRVTGPTGLSTATENVGGGFITLAGEIDTFTFATPVDFSIPGTYTIRIYSALLGEDNPANDTAVILFDIPLAGVPIFDDFNSYANGETVFPDWINNTVVDDLDWQVDDLGTGSLNTGPSGDASPGGAGKYIYMETSSPATWNDEALLQSQCLFLSAGTAPELTYAYHMYGAAIGFLRVDLIQGGVVTNLRTWNGQQQTDELDPWRRDTIDLTPYIGTAFTVEFTGAIDDLTTGVSSFTSDIALDDIGISNPLPDDVGATALLNPTESGGCDLGASLAVEMEFTNFGLSPQTGFDVGYKIDGPTGSFTVTENIGAVVVPAGGTATYTFATPVDLSLDGFYSVKTFTALPSDAIVFNDTLETILENTAEISTFPWVEDFELFGTCGTACASDCSGVTANNWIQDLTDDGDWLTDAGGTGSFGTGPAIDALPGTSTGQYLYTEASGCNNEEYRIISPCIDIGGLAIPGVRFSYHMAGDDQGTMRLDVSEDDGMSWTPLWTRSGPDQLSETSPWEEVSVSLAGFGPVIQLRFVGITGPGFESDMAIDAITVLDIPPFDDLGVFEVLNPVTQCELGTAETVTVVVRNTGTNDLSGYDLTVDLDGPTGTFSNTSTVPGVFPAGGTDTLDFPIPYDFSLDGDYSVVAYTTFPTDTVVGNDTTAIIVSNIVTVPFPAFDDFDIYPNFETSFDFLENDPAVNLTWQIDDLTTSSGSTGPGDDVGGGGKYVYMETSTGSVGDLGRICTPCLDLSGGSNFPSTRYAYHMYGATMGRLDVLALSEGDTIIVDSLVGQQQFDELDAWKFSTVDLSAFDSTQIQLCWQGTRGTSFTGDMALDNIDIRDPFSNDLRTTAIPQPIDACDLTATEQIGVLVGNVGALPQSNFNVSYQVDGGPIVTEVFMDTIFPDEDSLFVFSTTVDFSAEGIYEIVAWTDLTTDEGLENDTTVRFLQHIITVDAFPYIEDFEGLALGWVGAGDNSSWEIGAPAGSIITSAASGTNAMMTGLSTSYNDSENSAALTPCMDFSSLDNPGVKMSINYQTEAGLITAQDGFVLQSSLDNGLTWKNVGEFGDPGWYNFNNIDANPGDQVPILSTVANGWAGFSGGWQEVLRGLDGLGGEPNVAFRIAFASNGTSPAPLDGVAIDDFIVVERPAVFLGPDTAVCAGYVLNAGNPGLDYLWSTGETTQTIAATSSGLYTVTVSDPFGFQATDEVNITILPSPTVDLGPDVSSCGPLTLDAENPGASYFWNTGANDQTITVDLDGTYSVIVTSAAGCVGSDSITVEIESLPDAAFAYSISSGFVTFIDGSADADSYAWDFGDGGTSTDPNPFYAYSATGNYVVTLVVTNACGVDSFSQSIAIFSTGLTDPDLQSSLEAYPVPSSGLLTLEIGALQAGEQGLMGVFNAAGQMVDFQTVDNMNQLDFRHLAAGTYVLRIDVEGRQAARTISIE